MTVTIPEPLKLPCGAQLDAHDPAGGEPRRKGTNLEASTHQAARRAIAAPSAETRIDVQPLASLNRRSAAVTSVAIAAAKVKEPGRGGVGRPSFRTLADPEFKSRLPP
jgi:hypothetical protein